MKILIKVHHLFRSTNYFATFSGSSKSKRRRDIDIIKDVPIGPRRNESLVEHEKLHGWRDEKRNS